MQLRKSFSAALMIALTWLSGAWGCRDLAAELPAKIAPPNVLVILTDDQGWGDLSLHGNPNLNTPNIDSLARDGAQLTNFYVCPVCSPTRAEFLTGRYHTRMGVYSTSAGGERFDLAERTIGDVFSDAGYATAAYGKWHSGMQPPYHPNARGFDDFYGFCSGHWGNYFSPLLEHNGRLVQGDGFIIDDLTDHAIEFVRQQSEAQQPFFIYLPLNTPHSPMAVPEEDWAKFANKPLTPDPSAANQSAAKLDHARAALALCENIDDNVGRLLAAIDEQGVAPETIVVYFCDNGPNGPRFNGGMRGRKGSIHEGGIRSPCLIRYPNRVPAETVVETISASIDLLPTLASFCNVPVGKTRGPLDGRSMATALTGGELQSSDDDNGPAAHSRRLIFSSWKGKASVRSQRWRYIADGRLYDIQNDRREQFDVAADHPAVAQRLSQQLRRWTEETQPPPGDTVQTRAFPVGHADFPFTHLPARDGVASGQIQRSNHYPNCTYFDHWTSPSDAINFDVEVLGEGVFEVTMLYAADQAAVGTNVTLTMLDDAGQRLATTIGTIDRASPSGFLNVQKDRVPRQEGYVKDWNEASLGTIQLQPGSGTLRLTASEIQGDGVEMRLLVLTRREAAQQDAAEQNAAAGNAAQPNAAQPNANAGSEPL